MSGVSIKGWTLITENEDGIWVLGKRDKELCLLSLESLSVSDVALYWKSTEDPGEIINFFTNSFNGFKSFIVDLVKAKFDIVEVEINTETNELFFI